MRATVSTSQPRNHQALLQPYISTAERYILLKVLHFFRTHSSSALFSFQKTFAIKLHQPREPKYPKIIPTRLSSNRLPQYAFYASSPMDTALLPVGLKPIHSTIPTARPSLLFPTYGAPRNILKRSSSMGTFFPFSAVCILF